MEERGGQPATVEGTGSQKDAGLLRIDFPGQGEDENLQVIEWDEFFEKFDESRLAFHITCSRPSGPPGSST